MENAPERLRKATEAELAELLEFVRGKRYPYTVGLSVHRFRDDNGAMMAAMIELERRGLVIRHHEDDARIDWRPAGSQV